MIGILLVLRSIFLNTLGLASCFQHSFACTFGKLTSEVLTFDQLAFDEMAFRKIFYFPVSAAPLNRSSYDRTVLSQPIN